jgi:hypothetical protein
VSPDGDARFKRSKAASVKFVTVGAAKSCKRACASNPVSGNMCDVMTQGHLEKIRSALNGMDAVLASSHGGHNDDDALLEFRRLCWAALLLIDDSEAQQLIDLLVQCAKDLYSEGEGRNVKNLRSEIYAALAALRVRLHTIEGGYGKRWRDLRAA